MAPAEDQQNRLTEGYGQLCAVGIALDAVGDRWTLLILRDLARTPLRFTDLQAANPGVSPNLLSARLRKLEERALIEKRPLAAPAKGTAYALAPGHASAVVTALRALAELGADVVDATPPEELAKIDLVSALVHQMQINGVWMAARDTALRGHFVVDHGLMAIHITIDDTGVTASADAPTDAGDPVATVAIFPPTVLMRMMSQAVAIAQAEELGLLTITGDRDAALELLRLLTFEPIPPA